MASGTLALVGTPIGNLGDITLRAIETLRSADRIYAEDTRRTRALLAHLGITGKRLHALHAHSKSREIEAAIEIMTSGEHIALVTDAGMPSISDPGAELVSRARQAQLRVTVIPGPSAVTSALALSGFGGGAFHFLGFLPRKAGKRRELLQRVRELPCPLVLFESPKRASETLRELAEQLGARSVVICRELTKKFEEVSQLTLDQAADSRDEWIGELTIVVEGNREGALAGEEPDLDVRIAELLAAGLSTRDVVSALSGARSGEGERLTKREIYARAELLRGEGAGDAEAEDEGPEMW